MTRHWVGSLRSESLFFLDFFEQILKTLLPFIVRQNLFRVHSNVETLLVTAFLAQLLAFWSDNAIIV